MTSRTSRTIFFGMAGLLSALLIACVATQLGSNTWMLLTDRSNTLPTESSIFSFEPYVINQGSSNYWLYGKDGRNYYHFVHRDDAAYVYLPIDNACPGFQRDDIGTWCNVRIGQRR
jgi:ABC-type transport system substrate-binding protein